MAIDIKDLKAFVNELNRAVGALTVTVNQDRRASVDAAEAVSVMADVAEKYQRLLSAVKAPTSTELSQFFGEVGRSIVRAQTDLDAESRRYVADIVTSDKGPLVTPSTFRIPRVTASLKFALDTEKSRGLNLIFYRDSESQKTSHQQSIEFDISTVPPTPELIAAITSLSPRIEFVVSPTERTRIFEALEKIQPDKDVKEEIILDPSHRNRVLIARGAATDQYFLAFADTDDVKNIGIWHVDLSTTPHQLQTPWRFGQAALKSEDLTAFHAFLVSLQDRQASLLETFGS